LLPSLSTSDVSTCVSGLSNKDSCSGSIVRC
jgi:hypothetical protein